MQNDNYENHDQGYEQDDIDLAQFDDDFAEAEVEDRDFEPIPDGKYQVNVELAEQRHGLSRKYQVAQDRPAHLRTES